MIFSKPMGYAIRALTFLAENRDEQPILNSIIAQQENIPPSFLSRIFMSLVNAGIVKSIRGRNGGYVLVKEPENITLRDLMELFEKKDLFDNCLIGLDVCRCNQRCAFHLRWAKIDRLIDQYVSETTIQDLCTDREKIRAIWETGTNAKGADS